MMRDSGVAYMKMKIWGSGFQLQLYELRGKTELGGVMHKETIRFVLNK